MMICQTLGLLPSKLGEISASDYNLFKREYLHRRLLPQRIDFFMSQLTSVVAQVFSDKGNFDLNTFNPYVIEKRVEPAQSVDAIGMAARALSRGKLKRKVFTPEQEEQLIRMRAKLGEIK
jgi:endonuclease I